MSALPLGHDKVLSSHLHQGIGKKSLRYAGGIHGPHSLSALLLKLRQSMTLKIRTCSMNLCVSDAYNRKVLSEPRTLKITTESSEGKNWWGQSHRPTSKGVKLRARAWKGRVQGHFAWVSPPTSLAVLPQSPFLDVLTVRMF